MERKGKNIGETFLHSREHLASYLTPAKQKYAQFYVHSLKMQSHSLIFFSSPYLKFYVCVKSHQSEKVTLSSDLESKIADQMRKNLVNSIRKKFSSPNQLNLTLSILHNFPQNSEENVQKKLSAFKGFLRIHRE